VRRFQTGLWRRRRREPLRDRHGICVGRHAPQTRQRLGMAL